MQEVLKHSSANSLTTAKKKSLLSSLNELWEQMPSLLDIDHPCAQKEISEARQAIEVIQRN